MKHSLKFILTFLTFLFVSGPSFAATLYFLPTTSSIYVGDSINVDIFISGLGNDNLAAFDFNVNYDDSILTFISYTLYDGLGMIDSSDPLADATDLSWGDLGGGVINLSELSWLPDFNSQADTFTLATLSFTGIAKGNGTLSISNTILSDELGAPLDTISNTAGITVAAPVPEPGTMGLFSIGLLGLAGVYRRKKA